jgi:subtilisin family serine protease
MKKLFYWGVAIVLALLLYFNWGKSCQKDKPIDDDKDAIVAVGQRDKPIPNEYIILMPKDITSKKYVGFKKYLDKHFTKVKEKNVCPCEEGLQLWTGSVDFDPETEPPSGSSDTSIARVPAFFLMRNYSILVDINTPSESSSKSPFQNGPLVRIAILDTGVDTTLNSLSSFLHRNPSMSFLCDSRIPEGVHGMNMLYLTREEPYQEPIDKDGHGTFINGIIAGLATYPPAYNKSEQALNVTLDLLNVKIGQNRTNGSTLFKTLCGMHYAIKKKANIINASWHVRPQTIDINAVANSFLPILEKMKDSSIMLVASAGNKGIEDITHLPSSFSRPFTIHNGGTNFTADYSNIVVSVGSWNTETNSIANSSNRGSNVDIYAPGKNIRSLNLGSGVTRGSGTSYATPFVSQRLAELIGAGVGTTALKTRLISAHSRTISTNVQALIMR